MDRRILILTMMCIQVVGGQHVSNESVQSETFLKFYLYNSSVDAWNNQTILNVTNTTMLCGVSTDAAFEQSISEFFSGEFDSIDDLILNSTNDTNVLNYSEYWTVFGNQPFSSGCSKQYTTSPSVWDRKALLTWTRQGALKIYYSGQCERRGLRTWSNYCPAMPCGTGTHTEHGRQILERVSAEINNRTCSVESFNRSEQSGLEPQSVQTSRIMECEVLPNETTVEIVVKHYCSSIIVITHNTLKCGWKLVCPPEGPAEGCSVPMRSPPVSCNSPSDGSCPVGGAGGGAPGGAGFSFPCGCHRTPDPENSCRDCKTSMGQSGAILSVDIYRLHLDAMSNITVDGWYDVNKYSINGHLNFTAVPDIVNGMLIGNMYYDFATFVPRHVQFKRAVENLTSGEPLRYYTFDNLYGFNVTHNDSDYYDFAQLETYPDRTLEPFRDDRLWVKNVKMENGTYSLNFILSGNESDFEGLRLKIVTAGDILAAKKTNQSCETTEDCKQQDAPYCLSGFCGYINISENRTFSLANHTHERINTSFDVNVIGIIKPGNNITVKATLESYNGTLENRTVRIEVVNYNVNENLITDSQGMVSSSFVLAERQPTIYLSYGGGWYYRPMESRTPVMIYAISSAFFDPGLIVMLIMLLFFIVYAFKWHKGVPSTYNLYQDIKGLLK